MTVKEMPIKSPALIPFEECAPEINQSDCSRIQVALRALDDITSGRFTPDGSYFLALQCSGCALGSLAFSIMLGDGDALEEKKNGVGGPRDQLTRLVGKVYGEKQASAIECAYEGWDHEWNMFKDPQSLSNLDGRLTREVRSYRLRSILSNIILNKGHFDATLRVEPIA